MKNAVKNPLSYDFWRENIMDERLDSLDSEEKYAIYLMWRNEQRHNKNDYEYTY